MVPVLQPHVRTASDSAELICVVSEACALNSEAASAPQIGSFYVLSSAKRDCECVSANVSLVVSSG